MSHRCRIMKKPQAPPVGRRRRPGQGSYSERDPPGTDRTRPETRWRRWGLGPRSGARWRRFSRSCRGTGCDRSPNRGFAEGLEQLLQPDTLLPAGHPSSWGEQKASNKFSNGSGGLPGAMEPEQGFAEVLTIKAITKPAENPAGGSGGRGGRPFASGTGLESGSAERIRACAASATSVRTIRRPGVRGCSPGGTGAFAVPSAGAAPCRPFSSGNTVQPFCLRRDAFRLFCLRCTFKLKFRFKVWADGAPTFPMRPLRAGFGLAAAPGRRRRRSRGG